MLDNSEGQIEAEAEVKEPEAEVQAEEPAEEIVVSIDGEEPEPDPDAEIEAELGEAGKRALKAARDAAKENARKLREAEAERDALKAEKAPKEPELKRPTLEDCGFNEDVFAEKMAAFVVADDKRKADEAAAKAAEKADTEAYEAKRQAYFAERAKVGVDDEAEARVVSKLNGAQQTVLMDVCADPAKVVAALSKTPKVLDELAGIKQVHKFAHRLAQIEGKITVATKAPPPPETKLRGGVATADAVSTVPLDKLKARADASGDYTQYFAEKRRRADAGVKT